MSRAKDEQEALRKEEAGQEGGGAGLGVGMTHELGQVESVLCSCFFTGRNAAMLFGKASEKILNLLWITIKMQF